MALTKYIQALKSCNQNTITLNQAFCMASKALNKKLDEESFNEAYELIKSAHRCGVIQITQVNNDKVVVIR